MHQRLKSEGVHRHLKCEIIFSRALITPCSKLRHSFVSRPDTNQGFYYEHYLEAVSKRPLKYRNNQFSAKQPLLLKLFYQLGISLSILLHLNHKTNDRFFMSTPEKSILDLNGELCL